MKPRSTVLALRAMVVFFAAVWCATSLRGATSLRPVINSIQLEGTNVVLTISVPAGLKKITLESRARLGPGAWEPRAVSRLTGVAASVTVKLPKSSGLEVIRIRGDFSEPLPSNFYGGTNTFVGRPGSAPGDGSVPVAGPVAGAPVAGSADASGGDGSSDSRAVVESDIWKINGNTLYFFNQLRGLQLIDITNPDAPVVRGFLSLPATGEQMYVLTPQYVALLTHDYCSDGGSRVAIVATSNSVPAAVTNLNVAGWITESRLVGSALYVASESYEPAAGDTWQWGTRISSFDLSNPRQPVARGSLWFAGWGNAVYATDRFLFVATTSPINWWQSLIRIIDISSPNGTMLSRGTIAAAGSVADKFKMNLNGNIFTAVAQDWHSETNNQIVTKLQNFSLANPAAPALLGSMELAHGEQLRATRFDSNRVYITTFYQVDPLFIVDLIDPAHPRVAGQIDVPGWSAFLQPLGNRLITLSTETNRVAISLFDVANPAQPRLAGKVLLGSNYSWTEAESDEKAFNVLADANLILVPLQTSDDLGWRSLVQIVDLGANALQARGAIEHSSWPRRATLFNNRILSLSAYQLLSLDATDRDHPLLRAELDLAWPADRVFVAGNYLVQLSTGNDWANQVPPAIRISTTADHARALTKWTLTNWAVHGATVQNNKLYLLQTSAQNFRPFFLGEPDPVDAAPAAAPNLLLSIFDLSALPQITLLGQTRAATSNFISGLNCAALWPKPNLLVWASDGGSFFPALFAGGAATVPTGIARPIWWGGGASEFFAFNIADSAMPVFASEMNRVADNEWGASSAFATNGLVYVSHRRSEFIGGLLPPPTVQASPLGSVVTSGETNSGSVTEPVPIGTWFEKNYLDVIDYADARNPIWRRPVSIPGMLQGISHGGAMIYTVSPHWNSNSWSDFGIEWLDANAYDGVSAFLVDSISLSNVWPHPVLVSDTNIFVGRSGYSSTTTNVSAPFLDTWTISSSGKFSRTGSIMLAAAAQGLHLFGGLLAAHEDSGDVALFDRTNPAALKYLSQGNPAPCLGFDLERADGAIDRGIWVALGDYGVGFLSIVPLPPGNDYPKPVLPGYLVP